MVIFFVADDDTSGCSLQNYITVCSILGWSSNN